ncbi:hypothetical protein ENBRE01_3064 [Enteropsectra breve]|nr:hypothetical protein ENBRE01_1156 [Enteropsectra breve]KAI5152591.1 hypothetical protein ENBRE01_2944 [Enteropsectra breve]KAI5152853.1 hypothetical protein ENBRE01_3064 [Enteropsectra breve]
MDCIDLTKYNTENDGYSWILNIMDAFTKYVWSFPLVQKTGIAVEEKLKFVFENFGVPAILHSDNGNKFCNQEVKKLAQDRKISLVHGRPRHPQSQGQIERLNHTVKRW